EGHQVDHPLGEDPSHTDDGYPDALSRASAWPSEVLQDGTTVARKPRSSDKRAHQVALVDESRMLVRRAVEQPRGHENGGRRFYARVMSDRERLTRPTTRWRRLTVRPA